MPLPAMYSIFLSTPVCLIAYDDDYNRVLIGLGVAFTWNPVTRAYSTCFAKACLLTTKRWYFDKVDAKWYCREKGHGWRLNTDWTFEALQYNNRHTLVASTITRDGRMRTFQRDVLISHMRIFVSVLKDFQLSDKGYAPIRNFRYFIPQQFFTEFVTDCLEYEIVCAGPKNQGL